MFIPCSGLLPASAPHCFTFRDAGAHFTIHIYQLFPKSCANKALKGIQRDCIDMKMYVGCTDRKRSCVTMIGSFNYISISIKTHFLSFCFHQQTRQTSKSVNTFLLLVAKYKVIFSLERVFLIASAVQHNDASKVAH